MHSIVRGPCIVSQDFFAQGMCEIDVPAWGSPAAACVGEAKELLKKARDAMKANTLPSL